MKSLVKIDEDMIKSINSKMFKVGLLLTIFGSVIILLNIVLSIGFELIKFNIWVVALFVIPTGLGCLMLHTYFKAKTIARKNVREIESEFFDDHFESRVINNGEIIATQKISYNGVVKVKEDAKYLFIYSSPHTFVPVGKNNFTTEQLSQIKLLINQDKAKKGN